VPSIIVIPSSSRWPEQQVLHHPQLRVGFLLQVYRHPHYYQINAMEESGKRVTLGSPAM
jgi:hypothetical protein